MKICIDPGHGGTDPGATSNGILEKEYCLAISLELRDVLINNNIEVIMTRTDDEDLKDDERVSRVLNSTADFCLSIHFNASNGLGRGVETIYQTDNSDSQRLAEIVLEKISNLGITKRRAYSKLSQTNPALDYYFMLRRTRPINTVIVECLFIDNDIDREFLLRDGSVKRLAQKIGEGIFEYYGIESSNQSAESEHWAKPYLDKLSELGLIKEVHKPDDIPSWGELATMIVRTIEYIEKNNE